jgi:hypothetical protein
MGILNNDNDNLNDITNGNQWGGGNGATTKLIT